ncbi:YbaB/EbfC family nucleoid-associated protein [Nonomuraea sp. NPDC000554]|uniref:YbaB/EbfC family nucleoid-associated protein n=1 Tax=Nonomuraea sp. NPDC000554 TaxID=3154259 RepID=UPI0033183ECD
MYGSFTDPDGHRDQDRDQDLGQAEKTLAWIEQAQDELDRITGVGEAASGQIRAVVAADGKVLDVTFAPQALRLDSGTLAEETLSAVRQAQFDAERQTHDLMGEALDGFDPVEAQARFDHVLKARWR